MAYVRKNVGRLTPDERRRFVNALLEIKWRGVYDEFVRLHIAYYTADGDKGLRAAHMGPSFLPWHRRFLLDVERRVVRPILRRRDGIDVARIPDIALGVAGRREGAALFRPAHDPDDVDDALRRHAGGILAVERDEPAVDDDD